jgi:hypothetical protein
MSDGNPHGFKDDKLNELKNMTESETEEYIRREWSERKRDGNKRYNLDMKENK